MTAGPLPRVPTILMFLLAFGLLLASFWHRRWDLQLQFAAALLLGLVAAWTAERVWWIALFASFSIFATFGIALLRSHRSTREAESKADQLAV